MTVVERREQLRERRRVLVQYLDSVVEVQDWHGVMDAAADLREVEVELLLTEKLTALGAGDLRLDADAFAPKP